MLFNRKALALRGGAVVAAAVGFYVLFQGLNLLGSAGKSFAAVGQGGGAVQAAAGGGEPQVVRSSLAAYGYPNITVEAGRPVKWIIDAAPWNINGCNYRFIVGEYGIRHELRPGENVIEFTPKRVGKVPYSCWMGMIPGEITVVKAGAGVAGSSEAAPPQRLNDTQRPPEGRASCCPMRKPEGGRPAASCH